MQYWPEAMCSVQSIQCGLWILCIILEVNDQKYLIISITSSKTSTKLHIIIFYVISAQHEQLFLFPFIEV